VAGFEQAELKVEREKEFAELKNAIGRGFAPESVVSLLHRLSRKKLRVRDWDRVLASGVFDVAPSGKTAQNLYDSLPVSDQAQIREFYLFRVEEVSPEVRTRFHQLYQYY
jgi:hypothetical protein